MMNREYSLYINLFSKWESYMENKQKRRKSIRNKKNKFLNILNIFKNKKLIIEVFFHYKYLKPKE